MKNHLIRKVGFEGTPKLGPWVRISHGLMKLVTDLSNNKENDNNEQETSEMQFEDFALKTNVLAFASRSKAKAKPQRRTPASSSTKTVPFRERKWTDIEPEDYSPIAYSESKQLSTLLRHGHLSREDGGAIEFYVFRPSLSDHLRSARAVRDPFFILRFVPLLVGGFSALQGCAVRDVRFLPFFPKWSPR